MVKEHLVRVDGFSNINAIFFPFKLLPVIPFFFFAFKSAAKSIKYVMDTCQKNDVNITEPIILKNERLWNLICIRYQHHLNKRYGFYTPCIMCHMFTHLLRIPVFLNNKCNGIITGERFSHDGNIKANQHQLTINCFKKVPKSAIN